MSAEAKPTEQPRLIDEIRAEAPVFWHHMPDKGVFFAMLAVWCLFFHFLGNSVFGYIDTRSLLRWMYHQYDTSVDDEHGLMLPFVVIGLLYWKRKHLMALPKAVWWPALGLVLVSLMIHVFGFVIQIPQLSIVAFYFGIYSMTGLVWGLPWLKESFFPMLLFVFAVPLGTLGDAVTLPLRVLAATITSGLCSTILGVDVVRQGTQLFDPSGKYQYEVAAACGGIRSLIAMLGLATTYAFVGFQTSWRRTVMILMAFPLAVASNVFRLMCIIVAAELFGHNAGMYVHDSSILSLLPYIPGLAGLMGLAHLLRESPRTKHS